MARIDLKYPSSATSHNDSAQPIASLRYFFNSESLSTQPISTTSKARNKKQPLTYQKTVTSSFYRLHISTSMFPAYFVICSSISCRRAMFRGDTIPPGKYGPSQRVSLRYLSRAYEKLVLVVELQPLGDNDSMSGEDECLHVEEKVVVMVLLNLVSARAS